MTFSISPGVLVFELECLACEAAELGQHGDLFALGAQRECAGEFRPPGGGCASAAGVVMRVKRVPSWLRLASTRPRIMTCMGLMVWAFYVRHTFPLSG